MHQDITENFTRTFDKHNASYVEYIHSDYSSEHYMVIYGCLIAASLVSGFLHAMIYSVSMSLSGQRLHNNMLSALLRSPLDFFEKRETGMLD